MSNLGYQKLGRGTVSLEEQRVSALSAVQKMRNKTVVMLIMF